MKVTLLVTLFVFCAVYANSHEICYDEALTGDGWYSCYFGADYLLHNPISEINTNLEFQIACCDNTGILKTCSELNSNLYCPNQKFFTNAATSTSVSNFESNCCKDTSCKVKKDSGSTCDAGYAYDSSKDTVDSELSGNSFTVNCCISETTCKINKLNNNCTDDTHYDIDLDLTSITGSSFQDECCVNENLCKIRHEHEFESEDQCDAGTVYDNSKNNNDGTTFQDCCKEDMSCRSQYQYRNKPCDDGYKITGSNYIFWDGVESFNTKCCSTDTSCRSQYEYHDKTCKSGYVYNDNKGDTNTYGYQSFFESLCCMPESSCKALQDTNTCDANTITIKPAGTAAITGTYQDDCCVTENTCNARYYQFNDTCDAGTIYDNNKDSNDGSTDFQNNCCKQDSSCLARYTYYNYTCDGGREFDTSYAYSTGSFSYYCCTFDYTCKGLKDDYGKTCTTQDFVYNSHADDETATSTSFDSVCCSQRVSSCDVSNIEISSSDGSVNICGLQFSNAVLQNLKIATSASTNLNGTCTYKP